MRRSSPSAGYYQQFPRHGAKWNEEEEKRLNTLTKTEMLDVDESGLEYQ